MLYQQSIAILLGAAAAVSAQVTFDNNTGTFHCANPSGAYCASDSLNSPIIIRCNKGIGQPGNCNDNLAGVPPVGVKSSALCWQSSETSADAACSFDGTVYADGGSFPVPGKKPSTTSSNPPPPASSTPCSSSTKSTPPPASSTPCSSSVVSKSTPPPVSSTPCSSSTAIKSSPPPASSTPCTSSTISKSAPPASSTPCPSSSTTLSKSIYATGTGTGNGNNNGTSTTSGAGYHWSSSATPSTPSYSNAATSSNMHGSALASAVIGLAALTLLM